jgi:hypothetical protein
MALVNMNNADSNQPPQCACVTGGCSTVDTSESFYDRNMAMFVKVITSAQAGKWQVQGAEAVAASHDDCRQPSSSTSQGPKAAASVLA